MFVIRLAVILHNMSTESLTALLVGEDKAVLFAEAIYLILYLRKAAAGI